jgi:hypothetical protein
MLASKAAQTGGKINSEEEVQAQTKKKKRKLMHKE